MLPSSLVGEFLVGYPEDRGGVPGGQDCFQNPLDEHHVDAASAQRWRRALLLADILGFQAIVDVHWFVALSTYQHAVQREGC